MAIEASGNVLAPGALRASQRPRTVAPPATETLAGSPDFVELGHQSRPESLKSTGPAGWLSQAPVPNSRPENGAEVQGQPAQGPAEKDARPAPTEADRVTGLAGLGRQYRAKELSFGELQKLIKGSPEKALALLGKLPPSSDAAVQKLPASEQSAVFRLLHSFSGESFQVNGNDFFPTQALSRLLLSGKLQQRDSNGQTLLSNLDELSKLDSSSGQNLAGWLAVHAADPKRSYRQLPHSGTCVATSLSYMALEENPAEVARITLHLAGDGNHPLPNGESIKRALGSDAPPADGGSPVEQLLQASLTDYADPKYGYDFKSDMHYNGTSTRRARLWEDQQLRLADALSGVKNKTVHVHSSELSKLFDSKSVQRVAADIYWEKNSSPSLFVKAKHGRHLVVVTGVDDKYVYFRNPHGIAKPLEESSHKANNYGFGRMDRAEFDSRLHHVIVDSAIPIEGEKPVSRTLLSYLDQMLE